MARGLGVDLGSMRCGWKTCPMLHTARNKAKVGSETMGNHGNLDGVILIEDSWSILAWQAFWEESLWQQDCKHHR